jgi:hypothetical protein
MATPSRPDGHATNTSSACVNADVSIETASAAATDDSDVTSGVAADGPPFGE